MRGIPAGILMLLLPLVAAAEAPLPPPALVSVCSPSGRFCAVSDPKTDRTEIRVGRRGTMLWTVPGWHRSFFVSNDGKSLVVGPEGLNLVPIDILPSAPMLRFYHRGSLVCTVTLHDLVPEPGTLRRTASHLHWGSVLGIDERDRLLVELAGGARLAFDPATGARLPLR